MPKSHNFGNNPNLRKIEEDNFDDLRDADEYGQEDFDDDDLLDDEHPFDRL